jgi:hypothetical protein
VGAPPFERAAGMTRGIIAATAVLILVLGVAPDLAVRVAREGAPRLGIPATAAAGVAPHGGARSR